MKAGRKPKREWTPALEDEIVAAIEETGSQFEAAKRCGIHRQRIDEREVKDDAFRSRIARAREIGYANRAEQAVQAAKTAEDAAKGRLAFDADRWWLSKIDPARYGDMKTVEHRGKVGLETLVAGSSED